MIPTKSQPVRSANFEGDYPLVLPRVNSPSYQTELDQWYFDFKTVLMRQRTELYDFVNEEINQLDKAQEDIVVVEDEVDVIQGDIVTINNHLTQIDNSITNINTQLITVTHIVNTFVLNSATGTGIVQSNGTGNPQTSILGTPGFYPFWQDSDPLLSYDGPLYTDGTSVGIANTSPGVLLDIGLAGTTAGVMRLAGGTSGNVTLQTSSAAGTWTLTLPTTDGNSGEALITDGGGIASWAAPIPAAHDLLSAQHGDTLPAAVSRGSLIYGNATPKWAELIVGAANRVLRSDGTDIAWGQVVLTTDVTGVLPTAVGGTNHGNYTAGSVIFAGAGGTSLTEDNANFFWDDTNNRLGLGTIIPNKQLTIYGAFATAGAFGTSTVGIELLNVASEALPARNTTIAFSGSLVGTTGRYAAVDGIITGSSGDGRIGSIVFSTKSTVGATSLTERVRINHFGRVGIATGSPGALLDLGLAGTTLGDMRMAGLTSGNVTIRPAAIAGTWTLTLPVDDGAANQFLKTDGAGVTSWSSVVLTTDVSGILPTAVGGTNHGNYTAGSVIFAGAGGTTLTEDNANFFWDDTNNSLGLGTITPARTLSVKGSVQWGIALSTPGYNGYLTTGNTASAQVPAITRNLIGSTGSTYTIANGEIDAYCGIQFGTSGTTTLAGDISFFAAAAAFATDEIVTPAVRMHIATSGNVGIGISSAAEKLVVIGTICVGADNTASAPEQVIRSSHSSTGFANNPGANLALKSGYGTQNYGSSILFYTPQPSGVANTFGTYQERMRITEIGYVGIGTAVPGDKLEVNASAGQGILVGATASGNAGGAIRSTLSNFGVAVIGVGFGAIYGKIEFIQTLGSLATPLTRMTIANTGNVGIGIDVPLSTFHVVKSAIGATDTTLAASLPGAQLENATAATAVTTRQDSPVLMFKGATWNSTSGLSEDWRFRIHQKGVTVAGTTRSYIRIDSGMNSSSFANPIIITSHGGLAVGALWDDTPNGVVNAQAGFRIANTATSGRFLVGNGTNFVETTVTSTTFTHALLSATHTDTLAGTVVRGDIIYGNATPAWAKLAKGAANTVLRANATDVLWGQVVLTTDVTGVLPIANGGTNKNSWTAGSVVFAGPSGTAFSETNSTLYWDYTLTRLGIGNSAPSVLLDLGLAGTTPGIMRLAGATSGNVTIQTAAIAGTWTFTLPPDDGTANRFLRTDGAGVTVWADVNLAGLGVVGILPIVNGGTNNDTFSPYGVTYYDPGLDQIVNNATFFWDASNSRLGIGTAVPGDKLEVTASSGQGILVGATASQNAGGAIRSAITNFGLDIIGIGFGAIRGKIEFVQTLGSLSTPLTRMIIENDGNVGIGTGASSPTYKLDVRGSGNDSSSAAIQIYNTAALGNTSASAFLNFQTIDSGGFVAAYPSDFVVVGLRSRMVVGSSITSSGPTIGGFYSGQDVRFYAGNFTSVRAIINSTGFGVGNSAPGALVDIGLAGTTGGVMRLAGSTSGNVTIQTAAAAGAWALTLPVDDGAANTFLKTDGFGVTSWSGVSLTTDVSGVLPVANGGTNASSWTAGSVIFAGAGGTTLAQDNANLFWDDTTNRLGVGTAAPGTSVDVITITSTDGIRLSSGGDTKFYAQADGTVLWGNGAVTGLLTTSGGKARILANTSLGLSLETNGSITSKVFISTDGNVGIGSVFFGSSAVRVLAISNGTAPSSGFADLIQVWGADRGGTAGKASLHLRTEDGTSHVFGDLVGIGTTLPGVLLDVGLAGTRAGVMRLAGATSGNVTIQTDAAAGTWALTLPVNVGTSGQALITNGSGVTSWGNVSAVYAFTAGSVIFAGAGGTSLAEDNPNFFWDNAVNGLGLGTTTITGTLGGDTRLKSVRSGASAATYEHLTIIDTTTNATVGRLRHGLGIDISGVWSNGGTRGLYISAIDQTVGSLWGISVTAGGSGTTIYGAEIATNGTAAQNYGVVATAAGAGIVNEALRCRATSASVNYSIRCTAGKIFNDSVDGIICANAALATSATAGFLYIPTCAGHPTGAAAAETGTAPYLYDTTNKAGCIYDPTDTTWRNFLTPTAVTTELVATDTTVTVKINGTTYKLLAKA